MLLVISTLYSLVHFPHWTGITLFRKRINDYIFLYDLYSTTYSIKKVFVIFFFFFKQTNWYITFNLKVETSPFWNTCRQFLRFICMIFYMNSRKTHCSCIRSPSTMASFSFWNLYLYALLNSCKKSSYFKI